MYVYKHTNPATPPTLNHYFNGSKGLYHDAQSISRIVQGFIDAHPELVETINLPNKTYGYNGAVTTAMDGQPIDANRAELKLYRLHGAKDSARHGVFVYGSPHSREWIPKHALVEAMYRILQNYGNDAYITQLLDEVDIFYLPDCNPDGSMYSFHDLANFRKNRHVKGGAPEIWHYSTDSTCTVDINRNYSVGFGGGSSSNTCSNEAYHGIGSHSEPEAMNISWVFKQYPKIWVSAVCHSAGNVIFWPVAPDGEIPQLDSANGKTQSPDEILGGTTLQRSGYFNYMAQRVRAAIYDHRSTVLDQAGLTPGPTPGYPYGSGISTYEMYFNHTDNPLTSRSRTVKAEQWFEHPHKVYQYTFEMSAVGQRPAWSEADQLIMEWANGILELVASTRDLSKEDVFGYDPVASEDWISGDYTNKDKARGWASDWLLSGDVEMLTKKYVHNGDHTVRLLNKGRIERSVNLSGRMAAKLKFSWRAASWETSDKVYIKVNDGSGWTTVKTFVNGADDYYYHETEIDLSAFSHVSDFKISFEGAMSSTSDWFYLDHIRVLALDGIAYDNFSTNSFTGGQGWLGNWTITGTTAAIDSSYPLEGGYCAKITQGGKLTRSVDLTGVINPKLVFDSRSVYFEVGDVAYVKIDDGTGVQTVATITIDHSDKVYHQHVIDLSPFTRSANFKVIFAGAMDEASDYWYIDRVRILGDKVIATDNFDSCDFNGGDGFSYAWAVNGASINQQQQFSGCAAAQFNLIESIERTVDLNGYSGKKLEFVARVNSTFTSSDQFNIKIDDGAGWVVIKTLTSADGDDYYHSFSLDLSAYNHIATFKIAFEGAMASATSDVYIDRVQIV
ncbi:MAG: hypothetical protein JKX78_14955 [Alteromonadaceae bacterium]|nr:hypothetical protein [Alteromonadaceae bacterium]